MSGLVESYLVTEMVALCSADGAQTVTRPLALLTARYLVLFAVEADGSYGNAVRYF